MSSTPEFDPKESATTVYEGGTPYLEQGGELFTFAEYDQRTKEYNSIPTWVPKGKISSEEVTAAIDRLSKEFEKLSLLVKDTMKVLKRNEDAIPEQTFGEHVALVESLTNWDVSTPVEKKTSTVKKPRKPRGPRKKKVAPSVST